MLEVFDTKAGPLTQMVSYSIGKARAELRMLALRAGDGLGRAFAANLVPVPAARISRMSACHDVRVDQSFVLKTERSS
jgi:hypothetical protein